MRTGLPAYVAALVAVCGCSQGPAGHSPARPAVGIVVQLAPEAPLADRLGVTICLNDHFDLHVRWLGHRYARITVSSGQDAAAKDLLACMSTLPSVLKPLTVGALPAAVATRQTFAGSWFGHTRTLDITPTGHGAEWIDDGCCHHIIDMTFQLTQISGTPIHAVAQGQVLTVRIADRTGFDHAHPAPRVGDTVTLQLSGGLLVDEITDAQYCDDTEGEKGSCGV